MDSDPSHGEGRDVKLGAWTSK